MVGPYRTEEGAERARAIDRTLDRMGWAPRDRVPRGKLEGARHAAGLPLSVRSVSAEQAALPGFGATYREALEGVERQRYDARRLGAREKAATRIDADGVEWFEVDGQEDCQCARCGSTVFSETQDTIDFGATITRVCLSSPEWCQANPLPGREAQHGAGRAG